jgi:hypothetical protein
VLAELGALLPGLVLSCLLLQLIKLVNLPHPGPSAQRSDIADAQYWGE